MKYIFAIITLTFMSSLACADINETYDWRSLYVINQTRECITDYVAATEDDRKVLKAEMSEVTLPDKSVRTFVLTIGIQWPAPSFGQMVTSKLTITKVALRHDGPSPADGGTVWEPTVCTLTEVKQIRR